MSKTSYSPHDWLQEAERNLAEARTRAASDFEAACFGARQAVEHYLKGFLAATGQLVPYIDDIEELSRHCAVSNPPLDLTEIDLELLTWYAFYDPYDVTTRRDRAAALTAVRLAEEVRNAVFALVPTAFHPS